MLDAPIELQDTPIVRRSSEILVVAAELGVSLVPQGGNTSLLGGAVVTEAVFSYPGLGFLVVSSIQNRDYPVVQGTLMLVLDREGPEHRV